MTGSKPWYQSSTIRSAIYGLATTLAAAFKLGATGSEVEAVVAGVIGIVATVGAILGRRKAKVAIK
tara:strand:- start:8207 stop:8404 length:198 start_codon:yes stop_codon:yes gene_type:complete